MKPFKFIIALILYVTVFTISGESFQQYLSGFQYELYTTTFYLQRDQKQEQMIEDLTHSADRHNIEVFTIDYKVEQGKSTFVIYGTKGAQPFIEEKFGLEERIYDSIFLGSSKVKFEKFEDIDDISKLFNYSLIGDEKAMIDFKRELVNTYAGNFPRKPEAGIGDREGHLIYWGLLFFIMMFLTYYDILQQKKECFLRITFGESTAKIIMKNILQDGILLVGAFSVAYVMLHKITYIDCHLSLTLLCFVFTVAANSLMYLNLGSYDVKKAFSLGRMDGKTLGINYAVKTVSTILVVILMASNLIIIDQGIKFYKQKPFFDSHKEYSYLVMQPKVRKENGEWTYDLDRIDTLDIEFYQKYYEQFDATMLVDAFGEQDGFFANMNSIEYLEKEIPELKEYKDFKEDFLVIAKDDKQKKENIELAIGMVHMLFQPDMSYRVMEYTEKTEVAYVDKIDFNGSGLCKNPTIVLFNKEAIQDNIGVVGMYKNQEVLYKIDEKEFNDFIKSVHMENETYFLTNAYEKYIEQWVMMKRAMTMSCVITLLMLLFEILIIRLVIMQDYKARAVELSVKKILGYNLFEKNKKLFLLTAMGFAISVTGAVIGGYFLDKSSLQAIIVGAILLFLCEFIVMIGCIRKIEKVNVQKILKGGAL